MTLTGPDPAREGAKRTPGEWSAAKSPRGWIVKSIQSEGLPPHIGRATHWIAEINGDEFAEANVSLVAAARDLLEALQACIVVLEDIHTNHVRCDGPALQDARAAVAKATEPRT